MISLIRIIILCSLFLYCSNDNHNKIPPKVVKGVLDLSNWDLEKDGPVDLNGEWEFYWNEFIPPTEPPSLNDELKIMNGKSNLPIDNSKFKIQYSPSIPNSPLRVHDYINVPGNWNSYQANGKPVGSDGYATYRLRVLLPKSNYPLAFKIPDQATAYTMYVSGEKLTSMGSVGKDKETSIPASFSVISSIQNSKEELEILFHLSNFHYGKGGIWLPVKLGNEKTIRETRDKNLFLDLFLAGSILIMGLYHLVIFILRKEDKSPLFFGIYCFVIVMRLLSTGEKYLNTLFPEIPFQLLIKNEYFSFYLGVPFFSHFLYTIFPSEFKEKILKLIWIIGILFSISVAVTSSEVFTHTVNAYQIFTLLVIIYFLYLIGLAIFRKREGSKTLLIGFIILTIGVVNDIFYNMMIASIGYISPQCLLGFIFSQSVMLSMRFSKSFTQAEKLSSELEQKSNRLEETSTELYALTQNLELKIQERTKDLEETKKEIEELNTFSHLVNSLSNLNDIFMEVSKYMYEKYKITATWLFLPNEKREYLSAFKAYSYNKLPADKYNYMMNKKVPMKEIEGGMVYKTFQRKKPFYLSKIPKFEFGIDKEMVEKLSLISLLQVPLLRKGECVGIYCFSNFENEMKLSKSDIRKISNLCSQIAGSVDSNHLLVQVEKAKKEAEKQKQETEELNKLIKSLNEDLDFIVIMQKVLKYVHEKFNIEYYALYVSNPERTHLQLMDVLFDEIVTEEDRKIIKEIKIPLQGANGAHTLAMKSKKPFYLPKVRLSGATEEEAFIVERTKTVSYLLIPLFLQNELIGILDFTNSTIKMELSKDDITKLSILGEQLAGIIHGSNLFKQVQDEKEKALVARGEAEKQKRETEELNKLIKSLNEELDLTVIMQKVQSYINESFKIKHYGLYAVNPNSGTIYLLNNTFPDYVSETDQNIIFNFQIPIVNIKGAHAFTFSAKKPFYIPKIRKSGITEEELFVIEKFKIESFLMIPLILNNQAIGILDLYNAGKMELSKEDITKLSILGEHLAGIIHGSNLFKQVQEEKEKANAAREEAEKARKETESLNKLMKNINSVSSLIDIMTFIMYYLEKQLQFREFSLLLNDASKEELSVFSYTSPRASKEQTNYFKNWKKNYSDLSGLFSDVRENRKIVFSRKEEIRDADNNAKEWIEKGDFEYILLTPLVVYDELIAVLFLHAKEADNPITKEKLIKVEKFSDLVAGSIFNAKLLERVEEARGIAEIERSKSEKLLLNILPKDVASELKEKGFAEPVLFENVSVMFTDFKGFTTIAEKLTPQELIKDLDACFVQFDKISERFNLEKLKTIGDSYMCAGGIPKRNKTHAIDCCLAALEIQSFMNMMKKLKEGMGFPYWELRLGIHTGPLIAGVIGERKFAYDVWGDTVNTASRMESSGTPGRINISYSTYEAVKDYFECEYRGEVSAKNKGVVKMYYLDRIKREFSKDEEGLMPNGKFWEMYG